MRSTIEAADAVGETAVATTLNFLYGGAINQAACVNADVLRRDRD